MKNIFYFTVINLVGICFISSQLLLFVSLFIEGTTLIYFGLLLFLFSVIQTVIDKMFNDYKLWNKYKEITKEQK